METPKNEYLNVIKHTQLISVDLLIKNNKNKYLLGLRNNRPAKNTWFVPGGRVFKTEKFNEAVKRISKKEIGFLLENGLSMGVYRHLYDDNFSNSNFGTEYIVFPYYFEINNFDISKNDNQHSSFIWLSKSEILNNKDVHINVKKYFTKNPDNKII